MAALALIGAGVAAFGSYKQGLDKQAAYEASAAAKRAQAAQVQISSDRQAEVLTRQSEILHGAQVSAYGRSGVEAGHGSPLLQLEQTKANVAEQMQAMRSYADYHKTSILTEGEMDQILGGQAMDAGVLGAFGAASGAVTKNPYMYDYKRSSGGNL